MKFFATFAPKRPYTFVVLAILIVVYGIQAILTMATDVFPIIKIPVVAAVLNYTGLLPNDVSRRITYCYERAVGMKEADVAANELVSLSGSQQVIS